MIGAALCAICESSGEEWGQVHFYSVHPYLGQELKTGVRVCFSRLIVRDDIPGPDQLRKVHPDPRLWQGACARGAFQLHREPPLYPLQMMPPRARPSSFGVPHSDVTAPGPLWMRAEGSGRGVGRRRKAKGLDVPSHGIWKAAHCAAFLSAEIDNRKGRHRALPSLLPRHRLAA